MNTTSKLFLIVVFAGLNISAAVTLTESKVTWKTFGHTVEADYSLLNDTFTTDIVTHTFDALILENEYLKVTLVPGYGGRILSMIYKPTGHEQLYQNPVGRPYGPQWNVFYYDWLMVWGGIFPTFPEPEHGKAWCRPWAYKITRNTAEAISVAMTFTDSINFPTPATQFKYGTTNITCTFEVTLAAKSSALRTSVTLVNPNNREIPFEYWTNMGVAPGSVPGNTRCDDQTEIVGPMRTVKIGDDWPDIQKAEQKTGSNLYTFNNLRWYANWTNDGIAYAWPVGGNFWGALNHGNSEAIIRISDNLKTPGLKLWGFGYSQSRGFNPETNNDYHRPFIELWAGVSKEFFTPAKFPAFSTLQFDEYYTPTAGLTSFTHASKHAVIDLATNKPAYRGNSDSAVIVTCRYVITEPGEPLTLLLSFTGGGNVVPLYNTTRTHDTNGPFEIKDTIAVGDLCDAIDSLVFDIQSNGEPRMHAGVGVAFTSAGSCTTPVHPGLPRRTTALQRTTQAGPRRLYTISGACLGESGKGYAHRKLAGGVILSVDSRGNVSRTVSIAP